MNQIKKLYQIDSIKFNDKEVRRICDKNTNIEYYCLHDVRQVIGYKIGKNNAIFDQGSDTTSVKFTLLDTCNKNRDFKFIGIEILTLLFINSKNTYCHTFIVNAMLMKSKLTLENKQKQLLIENSREEIKQKDERIEELKEELKTKTSIINITLFYVRCRECNKVIGKRRDGFTDLLRKTITQNVEKAFNRILYNAYKYEDPRFTECFDNGHELYYVLTE